MSRFSAANGASDGKLVVSPGAMICNQQSGSIDFSRDIRQVWFESQEPYFLIGTVARPHYDHPLRKVNGLYVKLEIISTQRVNLVDGRLGFFLGDKPLNIVKIGLLGPVTKAFPLSELQNVAIHIAAAAVDNDVDTHDSATVAPLKLAGTRRHVLAA